MPFRVKATSESRAATAVYADDSDLVVSLAASTTYFFEVMAVWEAGATPDFAARLNYTGTLTSSCFSQQVCNANDVRTGTGTSRRPIFSNTTTTPTGGIAGQGDNTAETAGVFHWRGVLRTNTAGDLSLQWCQNINTVGVNTTVLDGSYIRYTAQGDMRGTLLVKTAGTTRASNVTPTDDPDLQFATTANGQYLCELGVSTTNGSGTAGFRKRIADTGVVDAVGHITQLLGIASGTEAGNTTTNLASSFQAPLLSTPDEHTASTAGAPHWLHCAWSQILGGSSSTTALEWAQNATNVSGTTVNTPSWLWYEEVP